MPKFRPCLWLQLDVSLCSDSDYIDSIYDTVDIYVTVSRKRMRSTQNLECEFYISADSVKRAL